MATIKLTYENAGEGHPDYEALTTWLVALGTDPMFVAVPQDIEVTHEDVLITEYLHNPEGVLVYDGHPGEPGAEVKTRRARYPHFDLKMPHLTVTEIGP